MRECEFDASNLALVFHVTIQSRRLAVDQEVPKILRLIGSLPCVGSSLDAVELALTEALANAVVHGNHADPSRKVEVCGACEGRERLLLMITDEGEGFDPGALLDPTAPENVFASHGRGVFLMKRLMDEVEFRLGGRQIVLRKKRFQSS